MPDPGEGGPMGRRLLNELVDPAHRLALSRFLAPCNAHGSIPEYWESALGEPPQQIVDRFVAARWLVPAGLGACIDHIFTVPALHGFLKARGLKVSGRKADLIDRIIAADQAGMEQAVSHADLLEVAPSIRPTVEGFVAAAKAEQIEAMEKSLLLLREGRLEDAVRAMARYEAGRVFPRGMGMDWSSLDTVELFADVVRIIFTEVPARLVSRIPENGLLAIRLAASMRQLWGKDNVLGLMDALPQSYKRFESRIAVFVYCHYAWEKRRLNRMRSDGVKRVEIQGDESTSCPACRRLIGKTYPIGQVPDLQPARCSCFGPSACYLVGNYKDLVWEKLSHSKS